MVCPKTCDTVLQWPKSWFYRSSLLTKDMEMLISTYHETVGRNCVLELDFAIDRDGLVADSHA